MKTGIYIDKIILDWIPASAGMTQYMIKPKVIVFSGYGLNCEDETKFAFETAGAVAQIIHINDLIAKPALLKKFQIAAFPGGFAYGDDTGSGNAYAWKVRNHLWEAVMRFVQKDNLVIGICNGFQIISNLGLLPALNQRYGKRDIGLLHNASARYTVRWVDLKVENKSPWVRDIKTLMVPTAHGEGRIFLTAETLREVKKKNCMALRYFKGEICMSQDLPYNPNGSLDNIAGLTDETGRVFGIMPHPERAMFFTQLPHWTLLKEKLTRGGKRLPVHGPGLQIFKNAVNYFL